MGKKQQVEGIVVGGSNKKLYLPRFRVKKTMMYIIAIVIAVLFVCAFAYWQLQSNDKISTEQDGTGTAIIDPLDDDVKQIDELFAEGKIDEARALATNQLEKDSLSDEERTEFIKAQIGIEMNAGNFQRAIDIYSSLDKNIVNHAIEYQHAISQDRLGNTSAALASYERTIELWPTDDPLYHSEIDYIQKYIDSKGR